MGERKRKRATDSQPRLCCVVVVFYAIFHRTSDNLTTNFLQYHIDKLTTNFLQYHTEPTTTLSPTFCSVTPNQRQLYHQHSAVSHRTSDNLTTNFLQYHIDKLTINFLQYHTEPTTTLSPTFCSITPNQRKLDHQLSAVSHRTNDNFITNILQYHTEPKRILISKFCSLTPNQDSFNANILQYHTTNNLQYHT